MTRDRNYYGKYKDISIQIESLDFDANKLDRGGFYTDEFVLSITIGEISVIVEGQNLLEQVASDYLYPLVLDFVATLQRNPNRVTPAHMYKHFTRRSPDVRFIQYVDDPWTIVVTVKDEECDLELYFGKKLHRKFTGIDFIRFRQQVRRLGLDFIKRICAAAPRFKDFPELVEMKKQLEAL